MKALTEQAELIIDTWFHEYCEGRCDKDEMVKTLIEFALQKTEKDDELHNSMQGEFDRIRGELQQPRLSLAEQNLFILDLLKLNKSEKMYTEETVINIIKQVLKMQSPKDGAGEKIESKDDPLSGLFAALERNAYNAEHHSYYYKQANQTIRQFFNLYTATLEAPDNRDAIIEKQRELIHKQDITISYFLKYSGESERITRFMNEINITCAELSALEAPPEDK